MASLATCAISNSSGSFPAHYLFLQPTDDAGGFGARTLPPLGVRRRQRIDKGPEFPVPLVRLAGILGLHEQGKRGW